MHPLSKLLQHDLTPDSIIACPNFVDPSNGAREEIKVSDMSQAVQAFVAAGASKMHEVFGDSPRTTSEGKVIYCDPRLKNFSLYTQQNMHGENAAWRDARDALKKDIVTMINFDRERERNELLESSLSGKPSATASASAQGAPPTQPARRQKMRRTSASRIAVVAQTVAPQPQGTCLCRECAVFRYNNCPFCLCLFLV